MQVTDWIQNENEGIEGNEGMKAMEVMINGAGYESLTATTSEVLVHRLTDVAGWGCTARRGRAGGRLLSHEEHVLGAWRRETRLARDGARTGSADHATWGCSGRERARERAETGWASAR
jgi:hypothetical protein